MKNFSSITQAYILGTIVVGLGLIAWTVLDLDWANQGLYVLAVLGAVAQTLKVEGPNSKTNYSIAWFVYGFAFLAYGATAAILVIAVSHLAEWAWHKYPWFIQGFNIGNHVLSAFLAGLVFRTISQGSKINDLRGALGLIIANLVFVLANHFLVGLVVKLARGQSFAESGVFEFLTLFLDFAVLSMGMITTVIWQVNPYAMLLIALPMYLLYNGMPALMRQVQGMKD